MPVVPGMRISTCNYCDARQTIPDANHEKKINLFNRANTLRMAGEFELCENIYKSILAEFPYEPEAYWGLCLCKYGVSYVEDPETAFKILSCRKSSVDSIFSDPNYQKAVSLSNPVVLQIYGSEAKAIDNFQNDIFQALRDTVPYDIFLCYAGNEDEGAPAQDALFAKSLYNLLTERGYRVFFQPEKKPIRDQEISALASLHTARVMVAVGTQGNSFTLGWMKNKWKQFLDLIRANENKALIACHYASPDSPLPEEMKESPALDTKDPNFTKNLLQEIEKVLPFEEKSAFVPKAVPQAETIFCNGIPTYLTEGNILTQCIDTSVAAAVIPGHVEIIGANAFMSCKGLSHLSLPEGLKEIGDRAFCDCENLTEVTIPGSVKRIGSSAFIGCKNLSSVTVGFGVEIIDKYAFNGCEQLQTISLPAGLKVIGECAFWNCNHLTRADLPEGLREIGIRAFRGCASLKSITISNELELLGEDAFGGCKMLRSVKIGKGLQTLENYVFSDCESLEEISVPEGVEVIGESVFSGCKNLVEAVLPEGLKQIGVSAFNGCKKLQIAHLPHTLQSIESHAFEGCASLSEISLPEGLHKIGNSAFAFCASLTDLYIPDSVEILANSSFLSCKCLCTVHLPAGLTKLMPKTFKNCESLAEIELPQRLVSVGEGAFQDCTSLDAVSLPSALNSIESYAFDGCTALKTVKISSRTKHFGDFVFRNCYRLEIDTPIASFAEDYAKENQIKIFENESRIEKNLNDQRIREEEKALWRSKNLCQHCGQKFEGLVVRTCSSCGKPKDY